MRAFRLILVIGICACGARTGSAQNAKPAAGGVKPDTVGKALFEPGMGTLKQEEFTINLRSGALLVKVTPLDEAIARLAAPDTYTRLHNLADSRRAMAISRTGARNPQLFLVSFFSYQPDVSFQPEDVQLQYNGKTLRASSIIPLTPSWGKQRMAQQETQAAIYVFTEDIDYEQPLIVRYGNDQNADWQLIIPKLQVERTKILSRLQKN